MMVTETTDTTIQTGENHHDSVHYYTSPTWRIVLAQATNGSAMVFYMLVTYMSYLANEGYGIVLGIAGAILTVTRVFDGLIDPLLAIVIDRFNPKIGKLRFFMTLGWVWRSLAAVLLFVWASGRGHGVVLFILLYCLYIIGSSFADITGNINGVVMTNDPKQRPMVGVWGTIYSYLTPMIVTVAITFLILPKYGNQYSVAMLAETCLWSIPVSLVFLIMSCIGVSSIDKPETFRGISASDSDSYVGAKAMWELIKSNRPFQMYIVSSVSAKLAQQTTSQAIVSTMLFGILVGNIQYGTLVSTISMVPSLIFAFIGAKHAGMVGNRKATIVWTWAGIGISAVTAIWFGVINMRSIRTSIIMTVIFFVLILAGNGVRMCVTTANTAMRADIVDYELDRSGKYMPGTVTATYNFVDQVISSLGTTIAAVAVGFIGYTTTAPQPTDAATPALKAMTIALYCGVPIVGWAIGLIAMKFYTLTKEEMERVQGEVEHRKDMLKKSAADKGITAAKIAQSVEVAEDPHAATVIGASSALRAAGLFTDSPSTDSANTGSPNAGSPDTNSPEAHDSH